jgi:membrane-associated protein
VFSALLAASFLNPQKIIDAGGLALVAAIIFAESGLLIGFFLPGDSLLFITGFLTSKPSGVSVHLNNPLPVVLVVLFVAAALGDQVGYVVGRRLGPSVFDRPKSRFFNPANVEKANAFFDRNGPKTIVLARFVPVVRTFTPIVAGVGKMRYRTFVTYNLVGAALWAVGVTSAGRLLGSVSIVADHVEIASLAIVIISLLPVGIELARHRRTSGKQLPPPTH